MAISQGLLLWLLISNLENNANFKQNHWKRSVENYSTQSCPSQTTREMNSFLWVMDRNPPVYFFGTIHVPYTKVWDYIPLNSKRAFKIVNNMYFELDLTDQENLNTLEKCKSLPNGVKLREVLPTTLYKRIKVHLSYIRGKISKWISPEQRLMGLNPLQLYQQLTKNWHKKRPIWLMLLLDKLTEFDIKILAERVSVLDTYLMREALSNHKKLGSIETVEEQCSALNKLNNSKVILALDQTLIMQEKIRRGEANMQFSTKQLIYHYNCGDLQDVLLSQETSSIANLERINGTKSLRMNQARLFEEYMKEELLFKRNRKMASKMVKIIKERPKKRLLFALGAGHFIGNRSIISILQGQGYKITHLKANDPLPRYGSKRRGKHCRKPKKKRRRNNRKPRRRRYHSRKHDNSNKHVSEKHFNKPKTTACVSCIFKTGMNEAFSSAPSDRTGQKLWITIWLLVSSLKMVFV